MKLENNFVSHNNYDFLFSVIYTALTLSRGESWSKSLTKQVRFPSFFLKEFCRFCRFFCSTLNSNKKKTSKIAKRQTNVKNRVYYLQSKMSVKIDSRMTAMPTKYRNHIFPASRWSRRMNTTKIISTATKPSRLIPSMKQMSPPLLSP